jgi:hypothetical protein
MSLNRGGFQRWDGRVQMDVNGRAFELECNIIEYVTYID